MMIAWREALDLVCRTRGTCLRSFAVDTQGRAWGGRCVRGCGSVDCQWLARPTVRRFARGTSPPDQRVDGTEPTEPRELLTAAEIGAEPLPLPDPPTGPVPKL